MKRFQGQTGILPHVFTDQPVHEKGVGAARVKGGDR